MPTKTETKENYPDWLLESIAFCRPPDNLTVTEFADRHELMDLACGNPYKSSYAPYQRHIMDLFIDPEVEQIWIQKPVQVGFTRVIFNILAYIICQSPNDTMIVYPTLELAEYASKNRIQVMINASPVLREQYLPYESTDLELHFKSGMVLILSGANSVASLASRPICYLLFDEVAKFPQRVGIESSVIALAIDRTLSFPGNRKIFGGSSPIHKDDEICKRVNSADCIETYYFTCTSCGVVQHWALGNLKWRAGDDSNDARETAYYECPHCMTKINDVKKTELVRDGHWDIETRKRKGRRVIGLRFNTFISPFIRLGAIAQEFVNATESDDIEMQNFINAWMGEPYQQAAIANTNEVLLSRQTELPEGVVPNWAVVLTAGIDVQQNGFYWVIRAWGARWTSQLITRGYSLSFEEVSDIMAMWWQTQDGRHLQVQLAGLDSGNDTAQVEEYYLTATEWALLMKGSSRPLLGSRVRMSSVSRIGSVAIGSPLLIVDTNKIKDFISDRMQKENGRGAWMIFKDCDHVYANMILSEQKIKEKRGKFEVEVWTPKVKDAPNHYLDCEVYAAAAADVLNVRLLTDDAEARTVENKPQIKAATKQNNNPAGNSWIQPKSWI
jgi:phage terminase large subunit GpA-like protein